MDWSAKTVQRFLKDVGELIKDDALASKLPDKKDQELMKGIWTNWASTSSELDLKLREKIVKERYSFYKNS